jgi:hypothetical protein
MQIHIYTERSDRRLLWMALAVVAIVLTWNIGSIYLW